MSGGYEFSHLFSANTIAFSPGTTFLATAYLNRIVVRSTASLQVVRTWACIRPPEALASSSKQKAGCSSAQDPVLDEFLIDSLQWSRDSLYLLVYSSQVKMAWVYGIAQEGESARIGGSGVEGLVRVEWGRGARDVLAWQEFDSKINIYDLSTGTTSVIQNTKSSNGSCHSYSHDSRYIAVAEKHLGKEYLGVYDILDQYALIRHYSIHTTDVQSIEWSPCGRYIAICDSPLSYSLHIHSALGPLLAHFTPASPTFSSTPNEISGLGIKLVTWAPSGRWLTIGGWDGKIRILENEGWRCVCEIAWGSRALEKSATIWREPSDWLRDTRGRGIVQFDRQPHPCGGGVYIWDQESGWVEEDMAMGDASVETGKGGNMEGVGVPTRTEFSAIDLEWSPDGTALAIEDRSQFCLLYDGDSAEEQDDGPEADRSSFMWDGVGEGLRDVLEEGEE
ncbi:hypothetical protein IAR50_000841 [Cryptococcus sp. DSM 104548]